MVDSLPPKSPIKVVSRPVASNDATLAKADAAVFVLERDGAPDQRLAALPAASLWQGLLRKAIAAGEDAPELVARLANERHTLVAVGFIKPDASGFERLDLAGRLMRAVLQPGVEILQLHAPGWVGERQVEILEALLSAALAAAAPMPKIKSKAPPANTLARIELAAPDNAAFERSVAISTGNHLARWLTCLPPNVLDTPGYRKALQKLARREGWSYRFYDLAALEELEAGAFLAVARANQHRGAGIARLTYEPQKKSAAKKHPRTRSLALVGKGICFDTGGINLKAHRGMYMMHGDMQGSAVAVGTLLALSRLKVNHRIDCWLAITENETGPVAYRPQEVVTASNGVTIQVVHSDAEGRMVLADTLALASREKPALLLDFATLTGACVNAITDRYSGAFTNRAALHEWLQSVGRTSGERVWCFPMDEDFDKALESDIADVLQCSVESKGDHILAARFLSRFVEKDVPWVHVDLAAAEHKGGLAHVPTEFTGFGVRYAVHLLGDVAGLNERLRDLA